VEHGQTAAAALKKRADRAYCWRDLADAFSEKSPVESNQRDVQLSQEKVRREAPHLLVPPAS
jgi:hypothetical protein